jgi:hypothetical protein
MSARIYRAMGLGAVIAVAVWLPLLGYWQLTEQESSEDKVLAENKVWAIAAVKRSAVGDATLRARVATQFGDASGDDAATLGECQHWYTYPIWRGSMHNPNWLSRIKDADAYRVVCDAYLGDREIEFVWDVSTGFGTVTGFSWGWAPE